MFHAYLYAADEGPIPSSFEAAAERLQQIEQVHTEPDGSFVWSDPARNEQLHGMLYDAEDQIRYVDLQGRCSVEPFRRIMAAIDPSLAQAAKLLLLPHREWKNLQEFEASSLESVPPAIDRETKL